MQSDDNVQNSINQPKNIVDVVNIGEELLIKCPEAHIVNEQWVISEKVQHEGDVRNCAPLEQGLRRILIWEESILDPCD